MGTPADKISPVGAPATGQIVSAVEKPASPPSGGPAPAAPAPPVENQETNKAREEMAKIIMEILNLAGELAFELADVDNPDIQATGLYKKAREIVRRMKRLKEVVEKYKLIPTGK